MLLHVDAVKYKCKPTKAEIGGIKKRFTKSASILNSSFSYKSLIYSC